MIKKRGSPKIFFGWWTVVAGSLIAFWAHGYYAYGMSALFKPIASELGFTRAVTSVASSIGRAEGGVEGPLTGWITDRFGPRLIIIVGVFVTGLGLILMNFTNSLWTFFVFWGVITGTGVNIGSSIAFETAISNWFVKKRGLALSIRWTVAGLCVLLVMPLVAWLITVQGWRMTCVIGGVVMWLVGLPLGWFCVKRYRPEYYGLLPDGATVEEKAADTSRMIDRGVKYAAEVEEVEFTLRQAMRTPAYWLLIIGHFGHSMVVPVIIVHSIPFLTDMGIDPVRAAMTVGVISITSLVTRMIIGLIADRFKRGHLRFLLGGAYLLIAVGIGAFLLKPTMGTVYVLYILYYSAFGAALPLNPIIWARYFGRKSFGSVYGSSMIFLASFAVVAPIYAGWVYDTTGSYKNAFILLAVLLVFCTVAMALAFPPKPPAQVTDIRQIL